MKIRFMHPAIGAFTVPLRPAGLTVIGRAGAGADIEITWDRRISRRHAELWIDDGAIWFKDLGSRNGSWRGESRLEVPVQLEAGTSILVGETAILIPERDDETPTRDVERTHESVPRDLAVAIAAAVTQTFPRSDLGGRPDDPSHTMDMPVMSAESSADLAAATPIPLDPMAPRLLGTGRVILETDREGLKKLWNAELSKGGLYVQTSTPPAVGTRVEVRLTSAGRTLHLNAHVVSVVTPGQSAVFQMAPGAGLQVTNLSGDKKAALKNYVEGLTQTLGDAAPRPGVQADSTNLVSAIERARQFLADADHSRLYSALGVAPTAPATSIRQAADALSQEFKQAIQDAAPPQAARLNAAQSALDRLTRVLANPDARLEYDFRSGNVRAKERMAAVTDRDTHEISRLRRIYNRAMPDQVDEAARLTRRAFAARQEQDLTRALSYGRRALEMNPFFEELNKTLDTWQRLQRNAQQKSSGASPRP